MTLHPIPFSSDLSCDEQAADWLLRLETDPTLQADCTAWCAADPLHQAAFDRARRTWDLCQTLSPQSVPSPPSAGVSGPAHHRAPPRWLAAACVALLLLAGGVFGPGLIGGTRTGTAEWNQLELSDGSHVLLAPQTALQATLSADGRQVTLDHGDAFFTVNPDRSRPFRVLAGPLTVTVTGTRFAVSRRDTALMVQVEEGRVLVSQSDRQGSPPSPPLALTAGQAASLDPATGTLLPYTLPVDAVAPWRSGLLAVENRTVAEVIDDLRPYLPGLVILTDDALARQRVTGVYSLHTPQAALRAVVAPFKGQITPLGPVATLISGPASQGSGPTTPPPAKTR